MYMVTCIHVTKKCPIFYVYLLSSIYEINIMLTKTLRQETDANAVDSP